MYEQQRKKGRPLTGTERSLIEHLYNLGFTQTAIAKEVGVWPSTICRELRRGMVDQLNGDTWEYYRTYSPQKAQSRAEYMKSAHGPDLKIGNRADYLAALEARLTLPTTASGEGRSVQFGQAPADIERQLRAVNEELARRSGGVTRGPIYLA